MNRRSFARAALGTAIAAGMSSRAEAVNDTEGSDNFSVMLWTLPKQPFAAQLDLVHAAGYRAVEIGNEYLQWTAAEWKSNLARLHALGMRVDSAVPGRNALANRSERAALERDLKRAIPGAQQLGCSQFIYTAYTRVPGQTPQQQRAAIVDSLKFAADILEPANFELVLEPIDLLEHKEEAVTSVVEAFEIVRAVGSPRVKVLFDFFHEQREAGNLIESLTNNIDQVGLVHIADVPGRHRPGTGEIHYANIYRALAKLNYQRMIAMEFLPVGDPVQELRNARVEAIEALQSGRG